tara:strand:+ start:2838 stop:3281 length:444 start_codon:yes stop_codon:yes gene_type:complete
MKLSFSNGFNSRQLQQKLDVRQFRKNMGGSKGLMKESIKNDKNDIRKPMVEYLENPQEIENKKNVVELEKNLADKNSLAKVWWDNGDNEFVGKLAPENNEKLIIASRAAEQKFDGRLQPSSNTATDSRNIKSIKELLMAERAKKNKR